MKTRSQIHSLDAERAAQSGDWAASIGHWIAADIAGAARAEGDATLRSALGEGRSAIERATNPAQRACFLAIKAMSTGDAESLDGLTRFLAEQQDPHALYAAAETDVERSDDLAIIARCFDRLVAIGGLAGLDEPSAQRQAAENVVRRLTALSERSQGKDGGLTPILIDKERRTAQLMAAGEVRKAAAQRATEEALPRLDALAEENPQDLQIRSTCYQLNLEVGRYRAALKDLRQMSITHADDPFVYINFLTLLRSTDHPEVKASVPHIVANLKDDPDELHSWFRSLLSCEAIPEAFEVLDRLILHAPEFKMIRDLRAMADDLDQAPAHQFGRAPSGRHLIYASMVCWGGKYLELMEKIAIASLLSPQNFPALCAENDVVIDFVTMPEDAPTLLAKPGIHALARLCEIRIHLFPEIDERRRAHVGRHSYHFLGAGSALTMKRAERDGADLIFLIPDVVYAEGSFAHVASLVTKEPRALMADGLNTFATPMLEALERHRDGFSLAVSIPDLIDYTSQNLMPRTTDFYFDPDRPDVTSYPQRVVFREQDGMIVHAFSKLAIYASHAGYAPLGQVDYGTPDSFFTMHLMKNLPKEALRPTGGDMKFLMVELAEDKGRLWSRTTLPLIDAMGEMYRHYGFHINCFNLFEIADRYPIRVKYSDKLTTAAQREAFLDELWEARRTRTVFTELCMERAKHDRTIKPIYERS